MLVGLGLVLLLRMADDPAHVPEQPWGRDGPPGAAAALAFQLRRPHPLRWSVTHLDLPQPRQQTARDVLHPSLHSTALIQAFGKQTRYITARPPLQNHRSAGPSSRASQAIGPWGAWTCAANLACR